MGDSRPRTGPQVPFILHCVATEIYISSLYKLSFILHLYLWLWIPSHRVVDLASSGGCPSFPHSASC